jgi:hypothetical protein
LYLNENCSEPVAASAKASGNMVNKAQNDKCATHRFISNGAPIDGY